jgi:hypothetical protein
MALLYQIDSPYRRYVYRIYPISSNCIHVDLFHIFGPSKELNIDQYGIEGLLDDIFIKYYNIYTLIDQYWPKVYSNCRVSFQLVFGALFTKISQFVRYFVFTIAVTTEIMKRQQSN